MSKGKILILPLLLVAVLAAVWFLPFGRSVVAGPAGNGSAMAEFNVEKLTCGSCVKRIEETLGRIPGIGGVETSVTSGRSRVVFDPAQVNGTRIAELITAAGYPATLTAELSTDEYRALQNEESRLGQKYVARIGQRLIPRERFESEVRRLVGEVELTPERFAMAQRQVWQELLRQELLLGAAEKFQVVVRPEEVESRLEAMGGTSPDFAARVAARFGSMERFRSELRNDLIIQRAIEDFVLPDAPPDAGRDQFLSTWYQELVRTTEVKMLDPQLKAATGTSGGCGGSCCG